MRRLPEAEKKLSTSDRSPRVRDACSDGLRTIPRDSSSAALASLLHREGIQGVAVTDELGCIVGVVSQTDLTREASWDLGLAPLGDEIAPWAEPLVQDLMTSEILAIDAEATLSSAAREMMARGVRRLLVRQGGRYVGMLTAGDLMRAWVRQSEAKETRGVQSRLERHLKSVEGLPDAMARQLAQRRAQAWAQRVRLREQRSQELLRRLREARDEEAA